MTSKYPGVLDPLPDPDYESSPSGSSPTHSEDHQNIRDAVKTIQRKVGTDGDTNPDSLDNRIAVLEDYVVPPPVTGDAYLYTHTQNLASNTWLIQHDLDAFLNVTVIDGGGNQVEGDVQYIDSNNIQVTFSAAFGGKAYLS